MKQHPRVAIVKKAILEFNTFYCDWMDKHELTPGELIKILSAEITTMVKYVIRVERHGRDDKEGDLE